MTGISEGVRGVFFFFLFFPIDFDIPCVRTYGQGGAVLKSSEGGFRGGIHVRAVAGRQAGKQPKHRNARIVGNGGWLSRFVLGEPTTVRVGATGMTTEKRDLLSRLACVVRLSDSDFYSSCSFFLS